MQVSSAKSRITLEVFAFYFNFTVMSNFKDFRIIWYIIYIQRK